MNSWTLLILIYANSCGKIHGFTDYSILNNADFQDQVLVGDFDRKIIAADAEGLNYTAAMETSHNSTHFRYENENENENENEENTGGNVRGKGGRGGDAPTSSSSSSVPAHHHEVQSLETDMSPTEPLYHRLKEVHQRRNRTGANDDSGYTEREPYQAPSRRDIADIWQPTDEIMDVDRFPWSYDAFYPQESKYIGNEYIDYPLTGSLESNTSVSELTKTDTEEYYKKIFYNQRYPGVGRNGKSKSDGNGDRNGGRRGIFSRKKQFANNACKLYLEFLKYAFQKLDESSEYNYDDDYNDDVYDDVSNKNPVAPLPPRRPTTDDSTKISHSKVKSNFSLSAITTTATPSWSTVTTRKSIPSTTTTIAPTTKAAATTTPSSVPITFKIFTEGDHFGTTVPPRSTILESMRSTFNQTYRESTVETYTPAYGETVTSKWPPSMRMADQTGRPVPESYQRTTQTYMESHGQTLKSIEYPTLPPTASTGLPKWLSPESFRRNSGDAATRTSTAVPTVTVTEAPQTSEYFDTKKITMTTYGEEWSTMGTTESYETATKDDDCNDKMLPCPDTYNITYPLNGYCDKYVSCESGKAIRRTCPEGLHFNIITKSCDLLHNSFCGYVCPKPDGYYGIPGDCGGYFSCKKSFPEYRMCPPKMHWDVQKNSCTFAESSSCPMKCTDVNEIKKYEGDCKAYIICYNGIPYYHRCAPNTKYDPQARTCVPDHLSECEDDPRLMTKLLNPNHLCRDVQIKMGTQAWCRFFKGDRDEFFEH